MSFNHLKTTITGILLLTSCIALKSDRRGIDQLREKIPQIQLPIVFNSDRKAKYGAIDIEGNEIIKRLIVENSFSLIGKLFETKSSITVLGYLPDNHGTPVVITINKSGATVSHALYETVKDGIGHHTSNIARILSNRRIVFTDSTVIRKISHLTAHKIFEPDSISVTHRQYHIAKNGTIVPVN